MDLLLKKDQLILIVDDAPKNIHVIGTILRKEGYRVSIATSGEQALKIVGKNRPHLILMDIIMPGMDGFETCRRMKSDATTTDIPVIFLSALSDTVDKVKGFKLGAVDFVSKPIEPDELLARIDNHLTVQILQRKLESVNLTLEKKMFHRTEELAAKNAELKESEERYRLLVETMNEGIIVLGVDKKITYANSRYSEMLGYEAGEMSGRYVTQFLNEENLPIMNDQLEKRREGQHDIYELEWRKKDGGGVPTMMSPMPIFDNDGNFQGSFAVITDITKRRRAEARLRRFRNLLSSIINSMPSMLVGIDVEGRVSIWNREAEKASGVSADDARGRPLADVYPPLAGEMEKVRKTILKRQSLKEAKVSRLVEGEMKYSDITVYPLTETGAEGAVIRIDDVTERVRMEEVMIQSEKMMSLGGLAAGMAHEINNPLSGILQAAQNALRHTDPDQKKNVRTARACGTDMETICLYLEKRRIFSFLEEIRTLGLRTSQIVSNMLQFSRPGDSQMAPASLPALMERAVELASIDYDLKKQYDFRHIEIVRDVDSDLPEVACVRTEITQVLLNLFRNAAEAMSERENRTEEPRIVLRANRKGDRVRIEVEDNGSGMDETVRKRIFEPFFTTKAVGAGIGLGLSVSYFIITNNHHGTMRVEAIKGRGTTFIIEIPVEEGSASTTR